MDHSGPLRLTASVGLEGAARADLNSVAHPPASSAEKTQAWEWLERTAFREAAASASGKGPVESGLSEPAH